MLNTGCGGRGLGLGDGNGYLKKVCDCSKNDGPKLGKFAFTRTAGSSGARVVDEITTGDTGAGVEEIITEGVGAGVVDDMKGFGVGNEYSMLFSFKILLSTLPTTIGLGLEKGFSVLDTITCLRDADSLVS